MKFFLFKVTELPRLHSVFSLFLAVSFLIFSQLSAASLSETLAQSPLSHGVCIALHPSESEVSELLPLIKSKPVHLHILAKDAQSLAAIRKVIAQQNLEGQVVAEHIPLARLPYPDRIANLVMIGDSTSLEKTSISTAEIDRIAVPGGSIVQLSNGSRRVRAREVGLGDWTHPFGGADGNHFTEDTIIKMPLGLRWQAGLPMNLVKWAAVRSVVVANGRCFTVGTTEPENLLHKAIREMNNLEYLTARDAFNGMLLWKMPLGSSNKGAALHSRNIAPIVADNDTVYAVVDGGLVAFSADKGERLRSFPTQATTTRLLLSTGVLVSGGWKEKILSDDLNPGVVQYGGLWAPWVPRGDGILEAFDAKTGKLLWSAPVSAQELRIVGDRLVVLADSGESGQSLAVLDIKTGKEQWKLAAADFAPEKLAFIGGVSKDIIALARPNANLYSVRSITDGALLWEAPGSKGPRYINTPIIAGDIVLTGPLCDMKTGTVKDKRLIPSYDGMCTPPTFTPLYGMTGKGSNALDLSNPKARSISMGANRGGCIHGSIPAHGTVFFAQNYCRCTPAQLPGLVAMGPVSALTEKQMATSAEVEKGPAFGQTGASPQKTSSGWLSFLGDATRSSSTAEVMPLSLKPLWQAQPEKTDRTALASAWRETLVASLTAPVCAEGLVLVGRRDAGTLVAFDAKDGKERWHFQAGGRLDSPPSFHGGLWHIGSHDGYLYAVRASDGVLAWRVRIAPTESRVMSFGQMTSVWPVPGSPLIHKGVCFVTAGRSSESDGGIVVAALDPATGERKKTSVIGSGLLRLNDVLALRDGQLQLNQTITINPDDNAHTAPDISYKAAQTPEVKLLKNLGLEGILDQSWTKIGNRRGGHLRAGMMMAELVAFDSAGTVIYSIDKKGGLSIYSAGSDIPAWSQPLVPNEQYEAVVLAPNAIALAGITASANADPSFFLRILDRGTGNKLFEIPISSRTVCNGMAFADGILFVATEDGSLLSFAKK